MAVLSRSYAYSKMGKEDPEEEKHRRAQFLIYKALEQADFRRRRSCMSVRISKLKIKIGKRLKRLRKGVLLTVSATRSDFYRQLLFQLKRLLRGGKPMARLSPTFIR
ncbi:hypothetical protein U1Q18_010898 [Sarracenia purpurea var. burkii]